MSTTTSTADDLGTPFFLNILRVSYFLLCSVSFIQMVRMKLNGSKLSSFRFGFHLLCFFWTLLRFLVWTLDLWHQRELFDLVWDLPIVFQIIMFALILIYYRQVLAGRQWRSMRSSIIAILVICAVFLLVIIFLNTFDDSLPDNVAYIFSAAMYGVLVMIAAYFMYSFFQRRHTHLAVAKGENISSVFVFLILLARCIFNLASAVGWLKPVLITHDDQDHHTSIPWRFFLISMIFEVAPTTAIIFVFRHIHQAPNSSGGLTDCCPFFGQASKSDGTLLTDPLADPARGPANQEAIGSQIAGANQVETADFDNDLFSFGEDRNWFPMQDSSNEMSLPSSQPGSIKGIEASPLSSHTTLHNSNLLSVATSSTSTTYDPPIAHHHMPPPHTSPWALRLPAHSSHHSQSSRVRQISANLAVQNSDRDSQNTYSQHSHTDPSNNDRDGSQSRVNRLHSSVSQSALSSRGQQDTQ
jgi:hypothetical protein